MKPKLFLLNVNEHGTVLAAEFPKLPCFGLYIISNTNQILRVGESGSGESRLKKGFREPLRKRLRGKERKNYIAYSWRDNYRRQCVNVDYFELKDPRFSDNRFRRTLEAELTFQFRIARKVWPREMSEIHFLERFRTDPLLVQTATAILSHYGVGYDEAV